MNRANVIEISVDRNERRRGTEREEYKRQKNPCETYRLHHFLPREMSLFRDFITPTLHINVHLF